MEAKISLISDDELADMEVSKQESEAFLKQHTPGEQVQPWTAVVLRSTTSHASGSPSADCQVVGYRACVLSSGTVCNWMCRHCAGGSTRSSAHGRGRGGRICRHGIAVLYMAHCNNRGSICRLAAADSTIIIVPMASMLMKRLDNQY